MLIEIVEKATGACTTSKCGLCSENTSTEDDVSVTPWNSRGLDAVVITSRNVVSMVLKIYVVTERVENRDRVPAPTPE
jgi:hypothetical protein